MRRHPARWLLPATLAWAVAAAAAQGTPNPQAKPPAADPLDATAKVAPLVYRSALATYKRHDESEPVPWREANDRVGRIGGWRAYAREANAPEAPEAPAAAPAAPASATSAPQPAAEAVAKPMSKPMPGAHGGHKMH